MCQRCLSGCFYKDLQFQPTYKPKNMTAAVKKKRCSGMLWGFFAAGQIGAAQNSQKRGHFETPSQEISNPSPGHRWRPQAFFHNCHKIPTSSPKKSWKHAWEQAGLLYTSSVRRDESHFLGSWRKAVWPKFGKLKTSKNEQRGCNPRTHRECDKRSKINLPLLLFGHFLI